MVDRTTGEIRVAQVLVGVLGASDYTYAEACWSQELPVWIGAHVRMLDYFGDVPAAIVPDNLKAGVRHACYYDPDLNPTYHELALHYVFYMSSISRSRDRAFSRVEFLQVCWASWTDPTLPMVRRKRAGA